MSHESAVVKQCCLSSPNWVFIYSDGRIYAICEKDFRSPSYRIDVKEIINMITKESFTPEHLFGDEND